MIYTGIGSRTTPKDILKIMIIIGNLFAEKNYVLRSGAADGADKAFEEGCDEGNGHKEIYLPFEQRPEHMTKAALKLAEDVWNYRNQNIPWHTLKTHTKLIMARNCMQVLGIDLINPTDVIICWTPGGEAKGGTGQALSLARMLNESTDPIVIPVLNLANASTREVFTNVIRNDEFPLLINSMKEVLYGKKIKERNS